VTISPLKQLAEFLRWKRGDQTFQQFARKIGLSDSTLQRIEMMQQNVTIDTLEQIATRFRRRYQIFFWIEKAAVLADRLPG
jgi:transcriptional regulator with XRE-family HTH domain